MNREPLSGRDWVGSAFPLDGPFAPDRAIEASRAVGELARYLAHATYPGRAVRWAPDTYAVLGALAGAAHSLAQVCGQVADRLTDLSADPTVRVDELGPSRSASELVVRAAERADAAGQVCAALAGYLDDSQAATSRLYHHEDDSPESEPGPGGEWR